MGLNVGKEMADLKQMTVPELREKYHAVFGEPTRAGNRDWLFKRIAWRIQSLAEGDLSERARQRAEFLARDADLRTTAPREPLAASGGNGVGGAANGNGVGHAKPSPSLADERVPPPGTVLTRAYRGRAYDVVVRDDGFEYDGQVFRSLSAIAKLMGRLTLNILLSFAQFEREIISERTRDKIAAARRRGKWMGGKPLLGYDLLITPGGGKLVVNDAEAARVRAIFELYLEYERIAPVLKELDRRTWRTKQWTTRRTGTTRGGRPFDKVTLFRLLTNPAYLGKVRHRTDLYEGEHDAIVDEAIWQRAQGLLQRNGRTGGGVVKNKYGALLKGLLRCVPCDCAMVHSTSSKGPKRYRYYVCTKAMKRGWYTCPSKSVPAGELERFVVDQIRSIGRDPGVLAETIRQVRTQSQKVIADLERERGTLERDIARQSKALKQHFAAAPGAHGADVVHRQDELRRLEARLTEVRERHVAALGDEPILLASRSITTISNLPPPGAFVELWQADARAWMAQHEITDELSMALAACGRRIFIPTAAQDATAITKGRRPC